MNDSEPSRLAALEQAQTESAQRIARLEQTLALVTEAYQGALGALNQTMSRVGVLENGTTASRVSGSLATASRLFPKTRSVVFVGRECGGDNHFEYFGDNIKYAYLAFCEQAAAAGVACHFLTDDERQYNQIAGAGLPIMPWFVPDWTAEHVRILLSARVAVLCNIFYPVDERGLIPHALLQGAKFIQLWHGLPLKEIGMQNVHSLHAYRPRVAEVLAASGSFDILVGPGEATRAEWAQRFAFHNYAGIGYPRTDVLFRAPSAHEAINVDHDAMQEMEQAAREKKPVILYVPTFRDYQPGVWFDKAGMQAFGKHCADAGWPLFVKLHPFEEGRVAKYRARYRQLRFIASHSDIYPLLRHASVLVTDYSSLAFDFLMLDRPIIFYRPDHYEYIARSRPLVPNAEDYICGEVVGNVDELTIATEDAVTALADPKKDVYAKMRQSLRHRLYDHVDGQAGQRLNQLIMEQL
jgi:CDP-glycerol glycerophosphotransferase